MTAPIVRTSANPPMTIRLSAAHKCLRLAELIDPNMVHRDFSVPLSLDVNFSNLSFLKDRLNSLLVQLLGGGVAADHKRYHAANG